MTTRFKLILRKSFVTCNTLFLGLRILFIVKDDNATSLMSTVPIKSFGPLCINRLFYNAIPYDPKEIVIKNSVKNKTFDV